MRVAFFLGALRRGGAESLVYDVCRRFESAPFEICCIYRKEGDYSEAFHSLDMTLIHVRKTGGMHRYLRALRKTILAQKIDIVHAQSPSNAMVCICALLFSRVKIVLTLHGFTSAGISRWYRKMLYRGTRKILCVSEYEKQFYADKWKLPKDNKLRLVYNGIDFSKLDHNTPDSTLPPFVKKDTLNMVMVGSFRSGRSQSFICRVAHELDEKGVPFRLYFIGRRDDKEYQRYDECVRYCQEHNLSEKVVFMGNRPDIPFLLKQMDLFVYASEHDTFGIAIIEALASNLPVIVNDWVVMNEITENGKFATIYKTDDIDDCTSKILEFKRNMEENEEEMKLKNQRLAETVRKKYSIDSHIHNLYDIYLSC